MRFVPTTVFFSLLLGTAVEVVGQAPLRISGTVYDSSKMYVIPFVQVFTTAGGHTETDSLGIYHITAKPADSIYFYYQGKGSVKYPVNKIYDYEAFDISMKVKAQTKYKVLQGVTVFSNDYRFDSLENRQRYDKIFNRGPLIETGVNPESGAAGIEIGSIISLFQFQKNRRRKAFEQRLIQQEEDAYIDYRFNSRLLTRITGLKGQDLEDYKKIYRPSYWFVSNSSLVVFYNYILNTSYAFKEKRGLR